MRRIPESPRRPRPGFTLIELLVVIAIIAVLMGLLLAGVMRVRDRAHEVQMRSDISQLSASVTQFTVEYNSAFIPSRIRLRNDGNYTGPGADLLDADSLRYLKTKLWPRLQFPVRWFPDHTAATNATYYELTGEQCLVFFLGGIQTGGTGGNPPICNGFSVNASNPAQLGGSRKMMFDFPTARLRPDSNVNGSWVAFVFLDTFETMPYLYYSSYGIDNYYRYFALFGASDCPLYMANGPYYQLDSLGNPQPYNRSGFQIIGAGKDKMFGSGGAWDSRTGAPYNSGGNPGEDDMANFHDRMLGIGAIQ
jgi:prepilin-type N-terminal cleavage/methylation domain-containing protein